MNNKEIIKKVLNETKPKKKYLNNAVMAFLFGGLICIIGQGFLWAYVSIFKFEENIARALMSISIIIIASILTGLGIFDKIGQLAGAGTYLPISGFANSMTSAAIESKSEGLIFGILSNMLKLAGTVIVAGVISAFIVSAILYMVAI